MKRILLALSLFVAATTAVFAQTAPHPAPPVVSKTEFTTKVSELNALITANDKTAADAKFHEISLMVNSEMMVLRYKLQDAIDTHNEADKTHYMDLSKSQRTLYAQTMQLKSDMTANKAAINEKLTTFANSIL